SPRLRLVRRLLSRLPDSQRTSDRVLLPRVRFPRRARRADGRLPALPRRTGNSQPLHDARIRHLSRINPHLDIGNGHGSHWADSFVNPPPRGSAGYAFFALNSEPTTDTTMT